MNFLSLFSKPRAGRCDNNRCTPQLETLDDRTLPGSFGFGVAQPVATPVAMPGLGSSIERSIVGVGAGRMILMPARGAIQQPPQEGQRITVSGTLHTGIVAIGGETTGYAIETADGRMIELQLNRAQQQRANRLDGRQIEVTGRLTIVQGVERPDREVIIVERMRVIR
jgi:hypothetical protein